MQRYLCIHGHFYQPPRENPWLEAVELQESAYPYHDWNERITAECYAPNAQSRILDGDGQIVRIVNNYSRISFNFGPTLLSWLEAKSPDTYAAILDADRQSRERFGGHGSALAQVYNHVIMPLANARDRLTQIRWGVADFARRFGRPPEGMWLAETAVNTAVLDDLAAEGIAFTILSPHQAKRCKFLGDDEWDDVTGGTIDPSRAYEVRLPSGRSIAVFFYDAPISQAIAFEGLLNSGERFAQRLLKGFDEDRTWPQLVHAATDGETYGHHCRHGDMALAYALDHAEERGLATLTNYGEFLELNPPTHEVEVIENSAWSCAHGVGRWGDDCGCRMSSPAGWTQKWRKPLRAALDHLRDRLAPLYEELAAPLVGDPWVARDDYVAVIFDRRPETVDAFLQGHAPRPLTPGEEVTALKLLELQRNCLLMYTSCGWFFDELSGIETVQVLAYAGRAIQLAEEVSGRPFEADFLADLARAPSNLPHLGDGRRVYEKFVRPARVDLPKVAAHYAVSALFETYPTRTPVFCYTAEAEEFHAAEAGKARLLVGRARVVSDVTRESADFSFGAVHLGDVNLRGGVRPYDGPEAHGRRRDELEEAFRRFDLPEVMLLLDREFDAATHSLRSLFRDERRKILAQVLDSHAQALEATFRQAYETQAPSMLFLLGLDTPLLPAFRNAAEFVLNLDLRRAFEQDQPDLARVRRLLNDASTWGVTLDAAGLGYALRGTVARLVGRLRSDPDDTAAMGLTDALLEIAESLSFPVDFWPAQNDYYHLLHAEYPARQRRAAEGDPADAEWVRAFAALGRRLHVRVPALD